MCIPPLFPQAPKKLVRYHGNQVVTTKGERYQLVKKDEAEDMKKTYVNLKPARKYRFHWRRAQTDKAATDDIVYTVFNLFTSSSQNLLNFTPRPSSNELCLLSWPWLILKTFLPSYALVESLNYSVFSLHHLLEDFFSLFFWDFVTFWWGCCVKCVCSVQQPNLSPLCHLSRSDVALTLLSFLTFWIFF